MLSPGNLTFATAGTYTISLTATDVHGASATATQVLQVNTPYTPAFTVNGRMYSNAGNVSAGNVNWNTANSACVGLTEGGGGWRLPTKAELIADVLIWKNYVSGTVNKMWGDEISAGSTNANVVKTDGIEWLGGLNKSSGYASVGYKCVR